MGCCVCFKQYRLQSTHIWTDVTQVLLCSSSSRFIFFNFFFRFSLVVFFRFIKYLFVLLVVAFINSYPAPFYPVISLARFFWLLRLHQGNSNVFFFRKNMNFRYGFIFKIQHYSRFLGDKEINIHVASEY